MSGPAVVWLVVGLVTTIAVAAVLIALVRHVIVLARALGRFQAEVGPIAEEIAAESDRVSARSRPQGIDRGAGRPAGPAVR